MTVDELVKLIPSATEKELLEANMPWPKSEDELLAIIRAFQTKQHDYGTCVYAMSMCALAAYYYMSHLLGVTGFQASCADMDFIGRSRGMKNGFRILNYDNLLYPQYLDNEYFPSWRDLLNNDDVRERLADVARERLAEEGAVSPSVKAHWEMLASA